jgi:hypothetical protein
MLYRLYISVRYTVSLLLCPIRFPVTVMTGAFEIELICRMLAFNCYYIYLLGAAAELSRSIGS